MSDYSTSTTLNETQYQENTPTITPEIVDAGSELNISEADDENNPIVLLSEKLPATVEHPLSDDECAFSREEAEEMTQDLQLKYHDTIESHYNLIMTIRKAHAGHIWLALGYPKGAAGWKAYCKDYFKPSDIKLTRNQRDDLILGACHAKCRWNRRHYQCRYRYPPWCGRDHCSSDQSESWPRSCGRPSS